MFINEKFYIGFRDIGNDLKISNKSMLGFLEDIAGKHSDIAKLGIEDIERTNLSWIALGWRLEFTNRPKYGEYITVKTWSRGSNKYYSYRDFEIYNENDEMIGKASSKWVLYDLNKNGIAELTSELIAPYKPETECRAFEKDPTYKVKDEGEYISKVDYKITRSIIDVNDHVHNTYYMDIAYEALPDDVYYAEEKNNVEVAYRKEIKYGSTVKCCYTKKDDMHIVVIKDENEENIHAVVKLY